MFIILILKLLAFKNVKEHGILRKSDLKIVPLSNHALPNSFLLITTISNNVSFNLSFTRKYDTFTIPNQNCQFYLGSQNSVDEVESSGVNIYLEQNFFSENEAKKLDFFKLFASYYATNGMALATLISKL